MVNGETDSTTWILRIGAGAGITGSLMSMVGNLLNPAVPSGNPEAAGRAIAESGIWLPVHLVIVLGLILMLGGVVAIAHSIRTGLPGALARLGQVAAVAGVTVGLILVIVDGVAAKHIADAWAVAPVQEKAAAVRILLAEETISFALAALFNIQFAGVTFILIGLAVAWSERYPKWWGWVVAVAGAGSIPVGLVQAYVGESILATRIATIVFPTVITLWVAVTNLVLVRKPSYPGDPRTGRTER